MLLLPTFDPMNPSSGQFNLNLTGGYGKAVVYNESNSNLKFTFSNGYTSYVPAWVAVEYCFLDIPLTNPIVNYSTISTVVTGSSSISQVAIEIYEASERVGGTYPAALIRQVSADVTSSSTTSLQNDGNAANTVYLEATQLGGPASNVSGTVDGSIQFNQWDGTTKKLLFQTIANAGVNNPSIKMLTAGLIAEVLGTLLIDNNIAINYKDNGGTSRRILQVDNNNNLQLFGITGLNFIQFLSSGGSVEMLFDLVNGLINVAGTKQTQTGDTSGTFDIYEFLSGPVKIVIGVQTNFRQAGAAQFTTLKTAFTATAFILNFGNGGVLTGTGGVADTNRQITWGTGTSGGSQSNNAQIPQDAAGFTVAGFTQVGNPGGYASAHGGICCWIGI